MMSRRSENSDEIERNVRARTEDCDNVEGNEQDKEESEIEEETEEVLKSHTVSWQASQGEYTSKIKVCRHYDYEGMKSVESTLWFNDKKIGSLDGLILPRPCQIFYEMAGSVSSELQVLSNMFCDYRGRANRIETNLEGPDVWRGGFFYLESIIVQKAHKGNDLGLRFLHETLAFLREDWNLIVMEPRPLLGQLDLDAHADYYTTEQTQKIRQASLKVCRHFARMRFQQAGRNPDHCEAWYMTSSTYFGDNNDSSEVAISRWKTKEQAQETDVFVPPEHPEPSQLDTELKDLISQNMYSKTLADNVVRKIEELVGRGASIHNSRALFCLVANDGNRALFPNLVRLGADVNAADENGNYPLHVAAAAPRPSMIDLLLGSGADKTVTDARGRTPLQMVKAGRESMDDFWVTFGLSGAKPAEVAPFLESAIALMPQDEISLLTEGWMSPRMKYMLEMTAAQAVAFGDSPIHFEPGQPLPLSECFCIVSGVVHFDYLPPEVLKQNPQGLYKSFVDGWEIVWRAIYSLLKKNQVPALSRVRLEIYVIGADLHNFQQYLEKGGKIEHALDALLTVTRNVKVGGGASWDYDMYEDEIEALPATFLDDAFDLARVKCLEIRDNNFMEQPRGPYRHTFDDDSRTKNVGSYRRVLNRTTNQRPTATK